MPESVGRSQGLGALIERARAHVDQQRLRQRVHLANIANADTPGYRARAVIETHVEGSDALARTQAGHLGAEPVDAFSIVERTDATPDSNGNNVELDEELAALAETAIDLRVTTRSLSNILAIYRSAATEVR